MSQFEKLALKITNWIGTPASLLLHTVAFILCLSLVAFGWEADRVLLFLTTAVSLEAIYLSIFIQMSMNNHSKVLAEVSDSVDELIEEDEGENYLD